jgi:hypothetical protein
MAASRSSATRATPGREFATEVEARFAAEVLRPNRKDETGTPPALSMIRQRIESVFWTLKDRLGLERHRARTLAGLRAPIASKLLALAAGVWVNTLLGLPSRPTGRSEYESPENAPRAGTPGTRDLLGESGSPGRAATAAAVAMCSTTENVSFWDAETEVRRIGSVSGRLPGAAPGTR